MKIKYHVVFAESIDEEIDFFIRTLGFEFVKTMTVGSGSEIKLLKTSDTDQMMAVADMSTYEKFKSVTILQSGNCLNDYFLIKKSGANMLMCPQYSISGLTAEFVDRYDNLFILLEERDYNSDDR